MKIALIVIFGILLGMTSCKKFEEGPGFTLRPRTNRVAGVWHIDSYTIDGADSLQQKNFETLDYVFGGLKCNRIVYGRNCPITCTNITAEWMFSTNLKNHIVFDNVPDVSPFKYLQTYTLWEIRRLTNKEMILQSRPDFSTRVVRMVLTKENNKRPCQ